MVASVRITQFYSKVVSRLSLSHTQRALCPVMEPWPQGPLLHSSQLIEYLDLCIKTHCCGWISFQSAYSILPWLKTIRQEPVMVFIKSHKSGSKPRIHGAAYSTSPMWNECNKKRNPLWAGNHLARVLTHISKSTFVVNVSAAIIHSCPRERKDIEPYS